MLAWKHFWLSRPAPDPGWSVDRRSTVPPSLREVSLPTPRRSGVASYDELTTYGESSLYLPTLGTRRVPLYSYDEPTTYDESSSYLVVLGTRRVSTSTERRETVATPRR